MKVEGYNLSMIRGDSESITITVRNDAGEQIMLIPGDTIYFTVKLNESVAAKILQKTVTIFDDGKAVIEILPEDTKDILYKVYKYDVQWVDSNGRVITIIPPSLFSLKPEITFETTAP